jgi:hypothetical protein
VVTPTDPSAARSIKPSAVRVSATPVNPDTPIGAGPPTSAQDDLTFEILTVPGLVAIRANVIGTAATATTAASPSGWRVNPVRANFAIALDRFDPAGWQDPDVLEGLSRQATGFVLSTGETHTIDLRLFTVQ